jgi:hypothetical protein
MNTLQQLQDAAEDLKAMYSGRESLFNDMEAMYFMQWDEEAQTRRRMKNVKLTLSPDARNQLLGAVRLMTATDPIWKVRDRDSDDMADVADDIEQASAAMWDTAGRISGIPIHHDVILSGLLYDEAHIAIQPTWLLAEQFPNSARVKRAAKRTPYLFEVYNPAECFARYDRYGMAEHLRYLSVRSDRVIRDYGEVAAKVLGDRVDRDIVFLSEYWTEDMHAIWIDGSDKPILLEEHGMDFIPIASTLVYGSPNLFQSNDYSAENHVNNPFLFTLRQSGLWERQNLALTVAYTMMFAIGANPMFVYKRNSPDKQVETDFSKPGGIVYIDQNETYEPLTRNIIDPAMAQLLSLADEKITDSTIYKQALGQPLSSGTPYSTVALLSQAGRLPLVSPQRRLSWLMGEAMSIAWRWMRNDKQAYKGRQMEVAPIDIPEDMEIECSLEISMPQDHLQAANIAGMLASGEDPMTSKEWARSNLLHIEQSSEEQRRIWSEQAAKMKQSLYFAQMAQMEQMKQQQAMQAAQQQAQPQPQPGQAPQQGTPMSGPMGGQLPPEMMAAGMQGPEVPPGEQA